MIYFIDKNGCVRTLPSPEQNALAHKRAQVPMPFKRKVASKEEALRTIKNWVASQQ